MKYIWEEKDIFRGARARMKPTHPEVTTIARLESPAQEHREWCMITNDTASVPYSRAEIADIFTRAGAIPMQEEFRK